MYCPKPYLLPAIARIITIIAVVLISDIAGISAQVIREDDPRLRDIDVIEMRGDTIPFDIQLTDDKGRQQTLGDYFHQDKPVVLVMAYYTCPMLCNLVLNGLAESAAQLKLKAGEDYNIITVSIDPTETAELAAAKKQNYISSAERPDFMDGWAFCVADSVESKRLADAIGFKYYWDEKQKQYAHAAVITILTSDGMISRYLYGIKFPSRDLKFSLLEAGKGQIGGPVEKLLLFCYHYDPDAGGYVVFATNVMKIGGALSLTLLAIALGILWIRELRRRSHFSRKEDAAIRHQNSG